MQGLRRTTSYASSGAKSGSFAADVAESKLHMLETLFLGAASATNDLLDLRPFSIPPQLKSSTEGTSTISGFGSAGNPKLGGNGAGSGASSVDVTLGNWWRVRF